MDYNLLQQHTVEIYQLRNHVGRVYRLPARSLLNPQRFDLFAKLYYIGNIDSNQQEATRVYLEHIKAFNPDGREPGRNDKNSVEDFLKIFNELINRFREQDFDETISMVPVDRKGVILDGAHRVSVLAYYDKQITIVQFDDVEAKCVFDYRYFKNRGLTWSVSDIIAKEMLRWVDGLLAACVWPRASRNDLNLILNELSCDNQIAYIKDIKCDLQSLANFVRYIYREQDWTQNPSSVYDKALRVYGKSYLSILLFQTDYSLEELLAKKETIRQQLGKGKDSLHITDNSDEALDIANITLDQNEMKLWMSNKALNVCNKVMITLKERWLIFSKVQWISFKVFIYRTFKEHN